MNSDGTIVGKNGYELLKANTVNIAMLQEIMAEKELIVLDKNDEYKNICQELNIKHAKECNSTN